MKAQILKLSTALLLLFLLRLSPVIAQEYEYVPFPDSNAVWSEYYWSSDAPGVYNKYALFNEDTLINGINYHKLFHTENKSEITRENSVCIGRIREDNKKVFIKYVDGFKPDEPYYQKEFMLYNFSLNEGDTVWNEKDNINGPSTYIIVKRVDTIWINNTKRKVFNFYDIPWTRWIEGIGNVQGLIFPSGDLTTGGFNSELICMHHNDTLMYFNEVYDGCVPQFVIDGVVLLPNTDIKVYPNPVSDGSAYFENLDFETLEVLDINGNLVFKEKIEGIITYQLKTFKFSPGIYFYRLKTKRLIPTQGKLIIQ